MKWAPQTGSFYRVRIGCRWTIAEFITPLANDEDAYWLVMGSAENFTERDFVEIGHRVLMPESMAMES